MINYKLFLFSSVWVFSFFFFIRCISTFPRFMDRRFHFSGMACTRTACHLRIKHTATDSVFNAFNKIVASPRNFSQNLKDKKRL